MKAIVRLMSVPTEKRDLAWVQESLRAAVELEMSTIPPYLYAAWSIDQAQDPSSCADTIRGIAVEEMLHLAIAANLLTAVRGKPDFVHAAPSAYPTQLPTHIHEGLVVDLASLSKDVLLKTFMVIEEPMAHLVDDDLFTPTGAHLIGQFYADVFDTLAALKPTFSTAGQVDLTAVPITGAQKLTITTIDEARTAIELITHQGEGTATAPFDNADNPPELAHFYKFAQIAHGAELTPTKPFSYTGNAIQMPVVRDVTPAPADLPAGKAFDLAYSRLLSALQDVWDGKGDLSDAMFGAMPDLATQAEALFTAGHGPAFRVVDANGNPIGPPPGGSRFARVIQILDNALGSAPAHTHGAFWRGLTRDQFVAKVVLAKPLLAIGDGAGSNLVKALRGQSPFGKDQGVPGATIFRMPKNLPPASDIDIDFIESWIDDGCPDAPSVDATTTVSLTTGAFRPDPADHVAYFRDLDDWAAWHATPDTVDKINTVQGANLLWLDYAIDATHEQAWVDAISTDTARAAFTALAQRQQQTVEAHYGIPVPLLTLLDGYERFGNDGLPDDPLRPSEPRHNMDSPVMWFLLGAFAEACVRLRIAAEFWTFFQRPILCGLLNDGLFRADRFSVTGFPSTAEGRADVFAFVQQVADADLAGEIRSRYAASGLGAG
ncbi:MAG: hypothetical protein JWR81_6704 [Pseudonocardia sp.]|nr:hypothetical protein [Pseudonocardia sp.]MDT7613660.1 hypothetical protein [Pseudonocardiales bacterium]